jgi:hypothetical protein
MGEGAEAAGICRETFAAPSVLVDYSDPTADNESRTDAEFAKKSAPLMIFPPSWERSTFYALMRSEILLDL